MTIHLIEIEEEALSTDLPPLSDLLQSVIEATQALYKMEGFVRPWTCYLAVQEGIVVGMCGFKSPPKNGKVEIAYSTLTEYEGKGIATKMARQLIQMAQTDDSNVCIVAQTLPEENASTAILKKLGFTFAETIQHPEDGEVWEWSLPKAVGTIR